MEGVYKVFGLQPGQEIIHNTAKIDCFEITRMPIFKDISYGLDMTVFPGIYIKLSVGYGFDTVMMSDTRSEVITNLNFIQNANGNVLIGGLGIGLIIHNLREKIKSGVIKSITVLEYNKDVIELVFPFYKDIPNLSVIHASVFDYVPESKFDTIYMDIWPTIDGENIEEYRQLKRKYGKYLNPSSTAYLACWVQNVVSKLHRQDLRAEKEMRKFFKF